MAIPNLTNPIGFILMSHSPESVVPEKEVKVSLIRKALKPTKFTLKVTSIGFLMMFVSAILGLLLFAHIGSLHGIKQFLQANVGYFLIWRVFLMAIIVYFYPFYIRKLLKNGNENNESGLSEDEVYSRQWLKSRWIIIVGLVCLELAINFDQIVNLFH